MTRWRFYIAAVAAAACAGAATGKGHDGDFICTLALPFHIKEKEILASCAIFILTK